MKTSDETTKRYEEKLQQFQMQAKVSINSKICSGQCVVKILNMLNLSLCMQYRGRLFMNSKANFFHKYHTILKKCFFITDSSVQCPFQAFLAQRRVALLSCRVALAPAEVPSNLPSCLFLMLCCPFFICCIVFRTGVSSYLIA